jgi:hypothetical protein
MMTAFKQDPDGIPVRPALSTLATVIIDNGEKTCKSAAQCLAGLLEVLPTSKRTLTSVYMLETDGPSKRPVKTVNNTVMLSTGVLT